MTKINFLTQILMIIFNQTNILAFNNFITIVMEQVGPRLSYWEYEIYFKDVDVFVIGSGIVGLSTAIFYKGKKSTFKNCNSRKRSTSYGGKYTKCWFRLLW